MELSEPNTGHVKPIITLSHCIMFSNTRQYTDRIPPIYVQGYSSVDGNREHCETIELISCLENTAQDAISLCLVQIT